MAGGSRHLHTDSSKGQWHAGAQLKGLSLIACIVMGSANGDYTATEARDGCQCVTQSMAEGKGGSGEGLGCLLTTSTEICVGKLSVVKPAGVHGGCAGHWFLQ